MEEIWKDIEGYEGKYFISNTGKVKNNKGKLLKPIKANNGYLRISLSKNSNHKMFLIHRLVANAFLENHENLPCINHIDCNKENNFVENLEFCTVKYNNTYGSRLNDVSIKLLNRKDLSKPIKCLDLQNKETTYFPSIIEAERQLNINRKIIRYSIYKSKTPYKNRFIFSEDK